MEKKVLTGIYKTAHYRRGNFDNSCSGGAIVSTRDIGESYFRIVSKIKVFTKPTWVIYQQP
jgi:hypothetical protein